MMKRYTEFVLTENHLKLISKFYVDWDDGGYDGAPTINEKRPYGNSDVVTDIAEILGVQIDESDESYDEHSASLLKLHRETATALQICLWTRSFVPGTYRSSDICLRAWEKVD